VTWAAAVFVLVGFLALARLLQIPSRVAEVMRCSRSALAHLRDKDLTDLQKEREMRAQAMRLLSLFLILTVSAAAALAVPVGVVGMLDLAGLVAIEAVLDRLLSWELLLATLLLGAVAFALTTSRHRP